MLRNRMTVALIAGLTLPATAYADVVTTTDGSHLVGTVQKMTPTLLELKTGYDPRHWVYSAGVDISGKKGNTDQSVRHVVADLALATRLDELRMYGSYENDQTDNDETADESIVGMSYNAYMADPWGWYVRGELERDTFDDVEQFVLRTRDRRFRELPLHAGFIARNARRARGPLARSYWRAQRLQQRTGAGQGLAR